MRVARLVRSRGEARYSLSKTLFRVDVFNSLTLSMSITDIVISRVYEGPILNVYTELRWHDKRNRYFLKSLKNIPGKQY